MAVLSEEAQGPRAAKDDELEQGFKHKGPTERERDREMERERDGERGGKSERIYRKYLCKYVNILLGELAKVCDVYYRVCFRCETFLSSFDKAILRFTVITQERSKLICK